MEEEYHDPNQLEVVDRSEEGIGVVDHQKVDQGGQVGKDLVVIVAVEVHLGFDFDSVVEPLDVVLEVDDENRPILMQLISMELIE